MMTDEEMTDDDRRGDSRRPTTAGRERPVLRRSAVGGQRSVLLILALFLIIGFAYSAINPLHEATDELRHYRFVQHLIQRRSLPVQGEAADLACTIQGHHPPLYYAAAALVTFWIDTGHDICYQPPVNPFWAYRYWEVGRDNKNQYLHGPDEAFPWRGEALAAHLARVVNLLFGAVTVWLTWATARVIWPGRPALAAGAAAFVAFNPMFLYMAAAINNDVAAAAAGAAIVYACVRLLRDERGLSWRWGVVLGALYGLALMSKFNLAAILVVIEAAVTWVAWRHASGRRQAWRQWIWVNLLIVGVAALLAGWWFARNQILYGEPTGFEKLTELWGVRDPRESFGLAVSELPYAWSSLWGRFGYGQIPLPSWIYGTLFGVLLLSVSGYLLAGAKRRKGGDPLLPSAPSPFLLLLALNVAVFFAVLFNYLLVSPAGPMGRFFFPALSSLAILMFYGLSLLTRRDDKRQTTDHRAPAFAVYRSSDAWLSLATNLFMVSLSLIALFGYLAPAYARPAAYDAGTTLPNAGDIRFDSFVALRGYAVDTNEARPGEPIGIDLYWEVLATPPGDYLLFVHLTDDETGALVAQRDTHPGLGNFPSSQWRPGDRFVERLSLYLPETAYAPAAGELTIGLYAPEGYRLGITDNATGVGLGDAYPIGRVDIIPQAAPDGEALPNRGAYNFEDRIRLSGYDYDRRALAAGEPIGLTLHWEALRPSPGDYDVELTVLDAGNNVVSSHVDKLGSADWRPGEPVVGEYTLPTAPATGDLRLRLVLLDAATGRRINRVGDDGRWIDDELFLSAVAARE